MSIKTNNNAEPVPEKCKVCKDFYGDVQYGGLCSVCFTEKSIEESTAKPLQQPLNDLPLNAKQEQIHQPQRVSPVHQQQPKYNQGHVDLSPVSSFQQLSSAKMFGFDECMSHGCVRPADEHYQGYCVHCFEKNVMRYQPSQQNQWQHDQQQWQQEKQARRLCEFQEVEGQHLELERMKRQQEDNNRLVELQQQEMMKQQALIKATQRNEFVPQEQQQPMQYQAQQLKPHETFFVPTAFTGERCCNPLCSDFAILLHLLLYLQSNN